MSSRRHVILVCLLLLGILGSLLLGRLGHPFTSAGYRSPKIPFSEFPLKIGRWVGEELPVAEKAARIGGWDECLHRSYGAPGEGRVVDLFLSYYGNKDRGVEAIYHNPTICLPSFGWDLVGSGRRLVTLSDAAKQFEVSLDRFAKDGGEISVLNFFVVNDEVLEQPPRNKPFWLGLDKLKLSSDPGYFVQVRILVPVEGDGEAAERLAVEFLERAGRYVFLHI